MTRRKRSWLLALGLALSACPSQAEMVMMTHPEDRYQISATSNAGEFQANFSLSGTFLPAEQPEPPRMHTFALNKTIYHLSIQPQGRRYRVDVELRALNGALKHQFHQNANAGDAVSFPFEGGFLIVTPVMHVPLDDDEPR